MGVVIIILGLKKQRHDELGLKRKRKVEKGVGIPPTNHKSVYIMKYNSMVRDR